MKYLALLFFFLLPVSAAAQTGGTFDLSHNVIAGGGGRSVGGQFTVEGTAGQNLAGTLSGSDTFRLRGGFWAFEALVPTAASASISGRILTANNAGVGDVKLVLRNPSTGEIFFNTISSPFGHYRFDEIEVGQTYILTVSSKRFTFEQNSRTFTLLDELTDFDFIAVNNN